MIGNILESQGFYRSLININVYFNFLQRIFFTQPVTWSVRCLVLKIMNFQDFLFAVNCIGSKTLSVMSWISQTSEIESIKEGFWGSRILRQIYLDRLISYTHIHFGSSQPRVSLKIRTCFPDQRNVGRQDFNPIILDALFLYPWKHQKNWCFMGVEKGCIGNKLVNQML